MKKLYKVLIISAALCFVAMPLILFIPGCSSAQTTAYKSIAATETLVVNANSAFLDSVVTGQTPTNSVPQVEAAFNDTQIALHAAAAIASGGNSAPVPPAVNAKATAFINLATALTIKK